MTFFLIVAPFKVHQMALKSIRWQTFIAAHVTLTLYTPVARYEKKDGYNWRKNKGMIR